MPAAIRFPAELPPPDPDDYGDSHEDTRSQFRPEIGFGRARNKYRSAPRLFDVAWTLSQSQYATLFAFFNDSIRKGEREFDIQLIDTDDAALRWFTVRWINEFDAEVFNGFTWRVSAQFRSVADSFASRPAGTDAIIGQGLVEVSCSGFMEIGIALGGLALVEFSDQGRLANGPMVGVAEVELPSTGYMPSRGELQGSSAAEATNDGRLSVGFMADADTLSDAVAALTTHVALAGQADTPAAAAATLTTG